MVLPAVIGAIGSIAGGLLRSSASKDANKQAADLAANNIALQREFAQQGVTWRADDVMNAYKKTGLHPLSLLGINPTQFSPVVGQFEADPMGEIISRMGQDVSKSLTATMDRDVRKQAVELQGAHLRSIAERGELENELLRMHIASARVRLLQEQQPGIPRMKSEGEVIFPGVERQVIPDVSVARTPRGGYVVLPGKEAQERMEEIFGLGPEWFSRNRAWLVTPEARQWVRKFLPPAPRYHDWRYNPATGEWLPSPVDYPDRHMFRDSERERIRRHFERIGL